MAQRINGPAGGQGTPEGGTTRSVTKPIKEKPIKALPESLPRRFQWEREG
jgi:hypothetical protein